MGETLFSIQNYAGVTVSCSKDQWHAHVIVEHPIMKNNVNAVKDTLKNPDHVYQSSQNANREVYFKRSSQSTYNAFTKVIVEYGSGKKNPSNTVGDVVTCFPADKEKGGIGNAVYPAPTDSL